MYHNFLGQAYRVAGYSIVYQYNKLYKVFPVGDKEVSAEYQ